MSIVKVIEVICEGATVEAALQNGITEAAKTVKHIKQVNVEHVEGIVEKDKIVKFRVIAKISFLVER